MKKVFIIVMVIALAMTVVFAEGSKETSSKKVLKIATNAAFPPYVYYENEKPAGIDVDIFQAICDKLGYEMQFNDMEFGSIISAVSSGKVDVGFGGITITEDRKKNVDFTVSYSTGIQSIIVAEGSAIKGVDDLKPAGIKIGVQQDTTGDIYATGDFGEDHIARFNKGADAVQALVKGKVDAVIIDDNPAKTFVSMNKGLIILPTAYTEEPYGFELKKGNTELYNLVNGALEALIADGTVGKIVDKYINAN